MMVIACFNDIVITYRSARLCNILYAASECTLNVIAKREECIRTKCHIRIFVQPCTLICRSKYFRLCLEDVLPFAVCKHIHIILADIKINRIISVRTLDMIKKRKIKNLR